MEPLEGQPFETRNVAMLLLAAKTIEAMKNKDENMPETAQSSHRHSDAQAEKNPISTGSHPVIALSQTQDQGAASDNSDDSTFGDIPYSNDANWRQPQSEAPTFHAFSESRFSTTMQVGSPLFLPVPSPEDTLKRRNRAIQHFKRCGAQEFINDVQLSHTVLVRLYPSNWHWNSRLPYRIFVLSEIDTIEKLKNAICQNFGRDLARVMTVNWNAYISKVKISCTPSEGPKEGQRLIITEFKPSEHASRLYAEGATCLKNNITHATLDCCCGECDNIDDIPEILVQLEILYRESKSSRPQSKSHRTALQGDHSTEVSRENVIPFENVVIQRSDEERAQRLADHSFPLQPRIMIGAELFRDLQERASSFSIQAAKVKKLRAENKELQYNIKEFRTGKKKIQVENRESQVEDEKLGAEHALLRQQDKRTIPASSPGKDPPTKRPRLSRSAKPKRKHSTTEQEKLSDVKNGEAVDGDFVPTVEVDRVDEESDEKEHLSDYTEEDQRAIREAMGLRGLTRSTRN